MICGLKSSVSISTCDSYSSSEYCGGGRSGSFGGRAGEGGAVGTSYSSIKDCEGEFWSSSTAISGEEYASTIAALDAGGVEFGAMST